jgi:hypothetical protein
MAGIFNVVQCLPHCDYCMDLAAIDRENPAMGRYTFPGFIKASTPRYVVLWDMHWHVIDCQRLQAAADLSSAMAAAIERLSCQGWLAEGSAEYGFVFVRREGERRLLMLTPRDPHDTSA